VERANLGQTNQITDNADRTFDIWDDVFADTVDIHHRGSMRNMYGPVLFVLDVEVLLTLPQESRLLVSKLNPKKWTVNMPDADRYFLTSDELWSGLSVGNFGQMLIIRAPNGIVPFGDHLQRIIIDEPREPPPVEGPEFRTARTALVTAAASSGLVVPIIRRHCNRACQCTTQYAEKAPRISYFFSP
jgi:hypothetical protein